MKIVSFNINGIRARLHQLEELIEKEDPDIICLQETKVHDDAFPALDIYALGYKATYHGGKAHYGVATLSKILPKSYQKGFQTDATDAQTRMLITTFTQSNGKKITIFNGYFPQGESILHPVKFPAKEKFYSDLKTELQNFTPKDDIIILGDFNVAPQDIDIGIKPTNIKRWLNSGKCSFQPQERKFFFDLIDYGFIDCFRKIYPNVNDRFTWFDYRSAGFKDNIGLRIDSILATESLANLAIKADISYHLRSMDSPSDHAPIMVDFDFDLS